MNAYLQNLSPLLLPVFLIVVMYLMIFLPQKKREKKTKQMLDALVEGNQVVTIGGVVGKVVNIKDDELTLETGVEKAKLKIMRWAVREVVSK
jgi:preprotein translocase subunit YajC